MNIPDVNNLVNEMTLVNQGQIAEQFTPEIQRVEGEIKSLQENIDAKETAVNDLYDTYITEAEGTAGTLKLG